MEQPPTRSPLTALVGRLLPRLRYPYLFLVLGGLFLVDLLIPDPIPLVDELLLAVLTFIAASFGTRKDAEPGPRDITPPSSDTGTPSLSSGKGSAPADDR